MNLYIYLQSQDFQISSISTTFELESSRYISPMSWSVQLYEGADCCCCQCNTEERDEGRE